MKKNLLILLLLTILNNVFAQKDYTNQLQQGYPEVVKPFFDAYHIYGHYQQSEVKTAQLSTGIDSLQVYFGIAENIKKKLYWTALCNNDSLLSLSAGDAFKEIKPDILTGTIEIPLSQNRGGKISLLLNLDTKNQLIDYKWIDESGSYTKEMKIINLDKYNIGAHIPDLSFQLLNDKLVSLNEFSGKTIVINWWHTRCGPCISEMPGLNSLVSKYSDNKNIVFLSVADNTIDDVSRFLEKKNFDYLQSVANENSINFFGKSYPKHFIINEKGIIDFYLQGGGKNTHKDIDKILDKKFSK